MGKHWRPEPKPMPRTNVSYPKDKELELYTDGLRKFTMYSFVMEIMDGMYDSCLYKAVVDYYDNDLTEPWLMSLDDYQYDEFLDMFISMCLNSDYLIEKYFRIQRVEKNVKKH